MNVVYDIDDILVDDLFVLCYLCWFVVVMEIYFFEVNGVVMLMVCVVDGLNCCNYDVQLICLCQLVKVVLLFSGQFVVDEVFIKGFFVLFYFNLCMGVFSKWVLVKLWLFKWFDVVYIVIEGLFGWLVLQVVQYLVLLVMLDYCINFYVYGKYYCLGLFFKFIMGYLCKFYNCCDVMMVLIEVMCVLLFDCGFEWLLVVGCGVDVQCFDFV